jgi:hypothetical protein
MDWWTTLGNYMTLLGDAPALAVDMALTGPNADHVGYGLAFGMQASPTEMNVYPDEGMFAEGA